MSIKPECDWKIAATCEGELEKPGAIVISPPYTPPHEVYKLHMCIPCYAKLLEIREKCQDLRQAGEKKLVSDYMRELLGELCDLEAELCGKKPDPIAELESILEHEVEDAKESLKALRREKGREG